MGLVTVTTVLARPDLIPTVARWLWDEWARHKGRSLDRVVERLRSRTATVGPEQTWVVLDGDTAVATASLVHDDLDDRPELTPWLASVYVDPPHRGRGHAARLVRVVEDATRAGGVRTLWLHSEHAAGLYAKLGWIAVGAEVDHGHPVTLMRRDLR